MKSWYSKLVPSTVFIKQSLAAHSWLGLFVGALMYLICLTGTIAVFYEEIERWEQPLAQEYSSLPPEKIEHAFNQFISIPENVTEHMYVVFPSVAIPRVKIASETQGWYLKKDGSVGVKAFDDWSHLLTSLHINLHLPINIGILLVSAAGALLCGLIVSGFCAHPSIFKDAFRLRLGNSERISQVDIHNRLSVWGAPFYLVIAITGAYFGCAALVIGVLAQANYDGDQTIVTEKVFGSEPELHNQVGEIKVAAALQKVEELDPQGKLLFMMVHDAGTESQFMEFFVQNPRRLIYSENYRFDIAGNYLGKAGFSDGEIGKQVVYSVYRLHFGHYGSIWVKAVYFVLGLALTVVSVSGINIWLAKRKTVDYLNLLWTGCVWGVPLGLTASAITQVLFHLPSTAVFWSTLIICNGAACIAGHSSLLKRYFQFGNSIALLILLLGYLAQYESATFSIGSLTINLILLIVAIYFCRQSQFWRWYKSSSRLADAPIVDPIIEPLIEPLIEPRESKI